MSEQPHLFPAFLRLEGRVVVVIGGGPVAASKVHALRECGAVITVVAPQVCPAIRNSGIVIVERAFEPADLEGAWLVVAAATPAVKRRVANLAARRRLFVNAVDDPQQATVYLGGTLRRGGVTIAVSTAGEAPALAGLLREGLETILPEDIGTWLAVARRARRGWRARGVPIRDRRPMLLQALNRVYQRRRATAGEAR